ncbi:HTH-type transcriptional regulator CynR [compost metagenome]|uniref:LysR family transcriptional regulator n=1 Tax=Paenibacillus rhizolycopersici TaxID=2780073 RepID=A0ABS2H9C3_9BACL|nr:MULTISPECIES: LysR family transcriptional regulator [Paenibacillus]MBM6998000.1 LysR family transcriptional regulator [Paenibacillus rhizolycopersici]MUG85158.1 LysR family transcriptional regulator [Paenibacillus timonensis]GIP47567.1 putative HTH-type transcriptional regulator YwbI [Paenibacillus sp. J53TS2]
MDIRQMQVLIEVARQRSFTKAAEAMYITQPTISKTIKAMEEELGVVLFDRVGKKIELTDAGRIIATQAQQIVTSFQNLMAELDDLRNLKKGHLRIGLPPMVGASFFPKVIGEFHQRYPDITIQLFEDGAKKVEQDVAGGLLDVGVVVLPTVEAELSCFPFVEEKLNLVVHPSHPLAEQESAELSELSQDGFVLFREDFTLHDRIIGECAKAGFQPHVIYESSQWDLISEMVAVGLGITLLPETICREIDDEGVRIIPLVKPVIPWKLGIVWRDDRYQSFATREWIRFAQEVLAPHIG